MKLIVRNALIALAMLSLAPIAASSDLTLVCEGNLKSEVFSLSDDEKRVNLISTENQVAKKTMKILDGVISGKTCSGKKIISESSVECFEVVSVKLANRPNFRPVNMYTLEIDRYSGSISEFDAKWQIDNLFQKTFTGNCQKVQSRKF